MTKRYGHLDPSDENAGTPSGTTIFEVVDINDPDKSGRVKVRPVGSMEQYQDPNQMQWIPVSTSFFPQLKGFGISPPHNFEVGTKVIATNNGQQGWIVTNSVGNTLNDNKADTHPETRDKSPYAHNRTPGGKDKDAGDPSNGSQIASGIRMWTNMAKNVLPVIREVYNKAVQHSKESPKERAKNKSPVPERFLQRAASRNAGVKQIGNALFGKGDTKVLENYMRQMNVPFEVPQTAQMLDSLRATAQSGSLNFPNMSLGGNAVIAAGLASVASAISNIQKENKENEEDPLEVFLRWLYKETTKKEPLDERGKPTREYLAFKATYLASIKV